LSRINSEFQTHAKVCLAWSYLYRVGVDQNKNKTYNIFQELIKIKLDQQNFAKFGLSKCISDQQNSAKYELTCCSKFSKGVKKDADKAYSRIKAFKKLAIYYKDKGDDKDSYKYSNLFFKIEEEKKKIIIK
ncbi:45029_t:CDS:2, partial [Gigaspora margarita]